MQNIKKLVVIHVICILIKFGELSLNTKENDVNRILKEILKTLEQQLDKDREYVSKKIYRRNVTSTVKSLIGSSTKKYYWQHQWDEISTVNPSQHSKSDDRDDGNSNEDSTVFERKDRTETNAQTKHIWLQSRNKSSTVPQKPSVFSLLDNEEVEKLLSEIRHKELLMKTNEEFLNYLEKTLKEMETKMKDLDDQIKNGFRVLNNSWEQVLQRYNKVKFRRSTNTRDFRNKPEKFQVSYEANLSSKSSNKMNDKEISNLLILQQTTKQQPNVYNNNNKIINIKNRKKRKVLHNKNKKKIKDKSNYKEDDESENDDDEIENENVENEENVNGNETDESKRKNDTNEISELTDEDDDCNNDTVSKSNQKNENNNHDDHENENENLKSKSKKKDKKKVNKDIDKKEEIKEDKTEKIEDKKSSIENKTEYYEEYFTLKDKYNETTKHYEKINETTTKSNLDILLTSLKKFLPFQKKNKARFMEPSIPLDIAYCLANDMEPKFAHVTICIRDKLFSDKTNE